MRSFSIWLRSAFQGNMSASVRPRMFSRLSPNIRS